MIDLFLAASALLLLVVIAVQNYFNPSLRQETISDGLYSTVPDHWLLDGAYIVLATALALAFDGLGFTELLALVAGGALLVTAVTNTFSDWVDKITNGFHSKLHSIFTIVMFLSMLVLEATQNRGWLWGLWGAGIALPIAVFGLFNRFKSWGIKAGPIAEKTAVTLLSTWLITWSFVH